MSLGLQKICGHLVVPIGCAIGFASALVAFTAHADDLYHARVSLESGNTLVRGAQDDDWSYATVNTLILPGDTLWIDDEGTVEVEMSGGTFLRMADKSKAEIQTLPPSASINAWAGSFYVQRISRSTGDAQIRTPAATVTIDRDTQVRVDVVGEGSTTVSVRWGHVRVATDGGAPVEASDGQRVYIDPGLLPSNPVPFDKTVEDSFDSWNRERARLLALGESAMPASVSAAGQTPIGYEDLASYGEWVNVDNRQYWRPTVINNYVPYRDGYWSYVPAYGYNWIGTYPFCYVTTHYGRWNYYPAYGWLWNYDPVWGPAWCATAYYGGNFVWSPLNYYNQPCSYGATFVVGGVPFSIAYSSYCRAPDLYNGPCSVYPCYSNMFAGVSPGNIYAWNIYSPAYPYPHSYPHFGSTALYRQYNPHRVIRGIESGGVFTVAASQRARALNSQLGRAKFVSYTGPESRSVRTPQVGSARQARVRATVLNSSAALDTGTTIRRAQRSLQALRGSDDAKPLAVEARRARVASLEHSASSAQDSKLPGATTHMTPDRFRNTARVDTIRGRGERAGISRAIGPEASSTPPLRDDAARSSATDRIRDTGISDGANPPILGARGSERSVDREARRLDTDTSRAGTNIPMRKSPLSGTSRTLDDTRVRVAPDPNGRTPVPNPYRVREPNAPGITGPVERGARSQPLGPVPEPSQRSHAAFNDPVQTYTPQPSSREPQRRIIQDTSRSDWGRSAGRTFTAPQQMDAPRNFDQQSRSRFEAPQAMTAPQGFDTPQPRFNTQQPQYAAPRARRSAPQVNIPQARIEAPQPRFQAPQPKFEAPQPRFEAPQPRFEAPRSIGRSSVSAPSMGGASRFDGASSARSGGGRSRGR